ncbi:MAG: hypothetical protein NXH75_01295 [Halobacteriovoraceae bacterium]|nr:hypothetical protein [Halobacteriovoraceae bacterium]
MRNTFFLPLILALFFLSEVYGQIEPPNYNFSLNTLADFYPGKKFEEMKTKYGKPELSLNKGTPIYKFYVAHIRYKFPVFVRIYKGESVGFFARLPSYFLHDVFHQSLINRYGKQDEYSKVGNSAVYIWNDEKNIKFIYQGQCTLNCFPMYLSGEMVQPPTNYPGTTDVLQEFKVEGFTTF